MFTGNSEVEARYAMRRASKSIEQIYQKLTQREHILVRPDSYVGSVEPTTEDIWIYDDIVAESMVKKKCTYVPAMLKIYDEILVNAADNLIRDPEMNRIDVFINDAEGWVSIYNNGNGIPIRKHATHDMYICELIFGNLLTGDNYNDNQTRCTGGRNGYGAKLTNVYSTKFIVETGDSVSKKRYHQVFEDNMLVTHPPEITEYSGESFTKVTFYPDFPRFKLTKLDSDHCALFRRRAYDVAGTTRESCRVTLNGEMIAVANFKDYVSLYIGEPLAYAKVNDRWEVALNLSHSGFTQVSFVNSISTHKGGSHIHHVMDPLVEVLMERITKEYKGGVKITKGHIRNHLAVYVNCLIENPHFDTQTKETHTTQISSFGSRCVLSDEMIATVVDSGVVDMILSWVKGKEQADLARKLKVGGRLSSKIFGLPKLEDANDAGTKNSLDCTLILTEGDSAKALAVAGLAVVGRDRYGVFPLRGKLVNIRSAGFKTVTNNEEIKAILKIIGLQYGQKSQDGEDMLKNLRYGSVMIMSDQDYDGSHIKGLIINLFAHWFPTLFKREGFMKEFVTPIVKVRKGKQTKCFFTMPDYERWMQENNNGKGWTSKYYKGLGTSNPKEAKEYFSKLPDHVLDFKWENEGDDEKLDMAFNLKRAEDRKTWIDSYKDGDIIDHNEDEVTYTDFIDKELVLFARYDVVRSVPSLVDGLKPGQRKVLFAAFKRKLYNQLKVAQFASYVSEHAAYHHGEASLEGTIVGMAQDFVGSNNLKLLIPEGQFGSRIRGGKDHSSSRYIHTHLNMPLVRALFSPLDDKILEYQNEEGQWIEPKHYVPVIPLVLVNGCGGIGTGYSTFIPPFNPRDVVENCRRFIREENMVAMNPWFRNFHGTVAKKGMQRFQTDGIVTKVGKTTLEITELPIRRWTTPYKEFLESLVGPDSSCASVGLIDFEDMSTDLLAHFRLELSPAGMAYCETTGFDVALKLSSKFATSNMMLFDDVGKVKLYKNACAILQEFAVVRLRFYEKRKAFMIAELQKDEKIVSNQTRFILMVISKELIIRRRKIKDLLQELKEKSFDFWSTLVALCTQTSEPVETQAAAEEKDGDSDGEGEGETEDVVSGEVPRKEYNYLLDMPLSSLTQERVADLRRALTEKQALRESLEKKTATMLWEEDLENLEEALDKEDAFYTDKYEKNKKSMQQCDSGKSKVPMKTAKAGIKRATKAATKAIEKATTKTTEKTTEKAIRKTTEKAATKAAAKAIEKATTKTTAKTNEKAATKTTGKVKQSVKRELSARKSQDGQVENDNTKKVKIEKVPQKRGRKRKVVAEVAPEEVAPEEVRPAEVKAEDQKEAPTDEAEVPEVASKE